MAAGRARQGKDTTVDAAEVERFARHAPDWWDPRGPMAALHKFNPVRLGYIRDQAAAQFGRDPKKLDCLAGLRMLDIGCGGGILSEPLARLGAEMVGADPAEENIEVAQIHAERSGVTVDYRATTAEATGGSRRALRRGAGDGGGRARHRRRSVRRHLRADGEAGRHDDRRHAEPHAQEFRARHRRRRIRAALAAARHAPMGQVRHARGTGTRDRTQRSQGDRRARRDLQSVRRPLAALVRHGRELHAGGARADCRQQ